MMSIAIYQLSFLVKFYQHLFNPITKLSHLYCFCCKITLSSAPSLKPAINVVIRQSQSAASLRLNVVKLAIPCNLFLIIQQ